MDRVSMASMLAAYAKVLLEVDEYRDSGELISTTLSTLVEAMMEKGVDPLILLGSLDIARANILHSYYEIRTKHKMGRGG
ncbi:MAG: hypothetical protein QQN63_06445 [Nitrosopumilus sp.]